MGNAGSWRSSASRTLLPPTGMQSLTSCRSASRFWATRSTSPIDEKPKRRPVTALKRLRNIAENPAVAVIVDRYEEDWTRLGWVMLRGRAEVLREGQGTPRCASAVALSLPATRRHADYNLSRHRGAHRAGDELGQSRWRRRKLKGEQPSFPRIGSAAACRRVVAGDAKPAWVTTSDADACYRLVCAAAGAAR